jgi:pilus assembly protein CpaC
MKKFTLFFVLMPLVMIRPAMADESAIHLTLGESKLVPVESAKKVAIGNPAIANVTPVSDDEILLSAKTVGNTNLIFIGADGNKESRAIIVTAHNLKKAMVEVGVEIMEIESQSALKAGLSWGSLTSSSSSSSSGSSLSSTTPNNLTISENSPPPLVAFGSFTRQSLTASLQLLVNRGKAKILAKPKLLAVSGEEASFLAGGELPYTVETKLGSVDIQWKPYGVKLKVKPTIDGEGNINSILRAEVSGVDTQNGISLNGNIIPALRTRWVETTVYMKSGSTLVIAGLIDNENQKLTSGIPILSDIPILGELFRFTDNEETQTELVIFVTPSLVGQTTDEG